MIGEGQQRLCGGTQDAIRHKAQGMGVTAPAPSKIAVTPIRRPTRPTFQGFWRNKIQEINNLPAHQVGGLCDHGARRNNHSKCVMIRSKKCHMSQNKTIGAKEHMKDRMI